MNVFILDYSVIKYNRSKLVELFTYAYDYVEHKFQRGFALLTLSWSNNYRIRKESIMNKNDEVIQLIEKTLNTDLDVIGMVKQLKQCYTYNGKQYILLELKKFVCCDGARKIFGS